MRLSWADTTNPALGFFEEVAMALDTDPVALLRVQVGVQRIDGVLHLRVDWDIKTFREKDVKVNGTKLEIKSNRMLRHCYRTFLYDPEIMTNDLERAKLTTDAKLDVEAYLYDKANHDYLMGKDPK